MTIKYILALTAAVALGMALCRWNFGVGTLMLATIPFAILVTLPRQLTHRKQAFRILALSVAVVPVYFLSFAPYLATHAFLFRRGSAPPWVGTFTGIAYAPHYYLAFNPNTQRPFLRLIGPHVRAWDNVFDSTFATYPSYFSLESQQVVLSIKF